MIKMGKDFCPGCGTILDAASHPADPNIKPNPKDLSVCIKCGKMLMYSDDMALISLPDVLYDALPDDVKIQLKCIQSTILKMRNKC